MDPQLYKRKVTTITTEYYQLADNGTLALTSWSTNGGNGTTPTNGTKLTNGTTPSNGTTPPGWNWFDWPGQPAVTDATAFTNTVVSYFDSYGQKMSNMINKATGTEDELSLAEEDMFKDIQVLGSNLRSYYSAEFTEKLNQILRGFALSELQVISLARQGLDTSVWINFRFNTTLLTDISLFLNAFNNFWNPNDVRAAWSTITTAWHAAVKAKIAKNQAETDKQLGIANTALKSFGTVVARGVMYQFPGAFTSSTAPAA